MTRTWTKLASLRYPRREFTLVHVAGSLYAIGGFEDKTYTCPTAEIECYSIQDNSWKRVAPMDYPVQDPSAVVIDGKIVVYGQDMDDICAYSCFMYDPEVNKWRPQEDEYYPSPRSGNKWERKPFLMVHEGVCYRICHQMKEPVEYNVFGHTEGKGFRIVSRVDLSEEAQCTFIDLKDEINLKAPEAFCIGGKVFLHIAKQYAYNTGIDAASASKDQLDMVKAWRGYLHEYESVTEFSFDILRDNHPSYADYSSDDDDSVDSFYDFKTDPLIKLV